MTAFWIAAVAATVAVLGLLVLPLMRKSKGTAQPSRADFDLTVYKDQLAEVDRDLERGVLSEDQALAARTEIERRMLAATGEAMGEGQSSEAPRPSAVRTTGALLVALLVVVPLGAFGIYALVGSPNLGDQPLSGRVAERNPQVNPAEREAQLRAMVKDLQARLEREPQDARNWNLLGKAQEMLGNQAEAISAFEKLVEVTDRHPDALIILAEALFVEAGQVVTPESAKMFKEARTQDPANPMTYYYVALERQQVNDYQGAIDEYLGLLAVSPSNGPWVSDIQSRIAALAGELGIEAPVAQMLPPVDASALPGANAGAPGPTQEQVQQAQDMSPEEQQAMIRSMVERLAGKLKDNPDDLAGWQRLAQAYQVLGDETGLAEAEAQIKRLGGQ